MILIDILMSTYNGELYLAEQIESILHQTYKKWRLLIRDDGSTDKALLIIKKYLEKYPEKIFLVNNNGVNLGACQSFAELLKHSKSGYTMFCDQDDVWLDDKIEVTVKKCIEMENEYGKNTPVLVHTDLQIVDHKLNVISPSFWETESLAPEKGCVISRILIQNIVTGCTMLINSALREKIKSIPQAAVMHDWWIALVAATFGKIGYLQYAPIYYRQHKSNVVGAKKSLLYLLRKLLDISGNRRGLSLGINQAKKFLNLYREDVFLGEDKRLIEIYASLNKISFIRRKIAVIKNKFYKNGFFKNLVLLLII